MATTPDKKQMWVDWTHDVMSMYSKPDDLEGEDLVDDMADIASTYADAMLDEFEERFGSGTKRKRRSKEDED
jgi:hypothetical protein